MWKSGNNRDNELSILKALVFAMRTTTAKTVSSTFATGSNKKLKIALRGGLEDPLGRVALTQCNPHKSPLNVTAFLPQHAINMSR
ncbi:unnamed protein product [Aspergillus oryzae]|uniref:Unnamed protein product n=2 Tax=Aspergillus oryzae TaxID=5062 RepID=A0AAN4YWX4_ASPOZ|nr:unnamed protein product [Aspergillus oryzae]GMF91450.1 unnamed protein product [Aspergillus oryzae]GMG38353.1 unnamed protein product [Aspergillus oryzae]GMG52668.1 unnamed protein product [Aspergillus oryzae var. brunneus]